MELGLACSVCSHLNPLRAVTCDRCNAALAPRAVASASMGSGSGGPALSRTPSAPVVAAAPVEGATSSAVKLMGTMSLPTVQPLPSATVATSVARPPSVAGRSVGTLGHGAQPVQPAQPVHPQQPIQQQSIHATADPAAGRAALQRDDRPARGPRRRRRQARREDHVLRRLAAAGRGPAAGRHQGRGRRRRHLSPQRHEPHGRAQHRGHPLQRGPVPQPRARALHRAGRPPVRKGHEQRQRRVRADQVAGAARARRLLPRRRAAPAPRQRALRRRRTRHLRHLQLQQPAPRGPVSRVAAARRRRRGPHRLGAGRRADDGPRGQHAQLPPGPFHLGTSRPARRRVGLPPRHPHRYWLAQRHLRAHEGRPRAVPRRLPVRGPAATSRRDRREPRGPL